MPTISENENETADGATRKVEAWHNADVPVPADSKKTAESEVLTVSAVSESPAADEVEKPETEPVEAVGRAIVSEAWIRLTMFRI